MKIVCDKCNARYSLPDEKIRNIGRTRFGVKCKTCGNLIRVTVVEAPVEPTPDELRGFTPAPPPPREKGGVDIFSDADLEGEFGKAFGGHTPGRQSHPLEPAARASAASPESSGDAGPGATAVAKKGREDTKLYDYREFQALLKEKGLLTPSPKSTTTKEPEVEWYLALDGNQMGPFARMVAESRVLADPDLAENGFAWRDGLADWLPVVDLPELRDAARKAIAARVVSPPPVAAAPAATPKALAPPPQPAEPNSGILAPTAAVAGTDLPKQRNEQSVLFSLDALKASTMAAKEEAPVQVAPAGASGGGTVAQTAAKSEIEASPVAPRPIATPIHFSASAAVLRPPAGPTKKTSRLAMGLGFAVVAGGGAAVAYFAIQQRTPAPAPIAQATVDSEARRPEAESAARTAAVERVQPDPRTLPTPAAASVAGRNDARVDARVDARDGLRDAARLPLPEGTPPTNVPALAGATAVQPATAQPIDTRATEAPRATAASAPADDDDPRDRRRRKGKRRRGRETTVSVSATAPVTTATTSASTQPVAERSETTARAVTPPPPSAARGDAVLDDILGGGGSSTPPARAEAPRPARRAEVRRAEARAVAPPPRREEPIADPPTRADPPREPARAAESSLPRTLDGGDIKSQVERNRHRVNLCYSSTVADKSEKKGRLVVSFTIERNGRPSRVGVDRAGYWGSEMASCVTTAFSRLRFGQFSGDPIEVRFPFVLGDF